MPQESSAVYEILAAELRGMLTALKSDTPSNFRRKANNFLLSRFEPEVIFYTVFTSSFESKSGNAMENCAKAIARLRYGTEAVPSVIVGLGATPEDAASFLVTDPNKQIILARKSISQVNQHAHAVLSAHRASGRGRSKSLAAGVTQELLRTEILSAVYPDSVILEQKPVDLFIVAPDGSSYCLEVKLGGELDSSNAPAQIAKFLTTCALAGDHNLRGYFATIYNKEGEGNRFTGTVSSYLAADMILAGSAFWELLLPPSIPFNDFVGLYKKALDAVGMNAAIRELAAATTLSPKDKEEVIAELGP